MTKRVECLCPQRHVLMAADVPEDLDDTYAIEEMRWQVNAFLRRQRFIYCCKCGAPPETWLCEVRTHSNNYSSMSEVPSQSPDTATLSPDVTPAGRQIENELREWKRPEGLTVLN